MIIILLCAVGGAVFGWYSRSKEPQSVTKCTKPGLGRVVYALKPIPRGAQIKLGSVKERALERLKVPERALPAVGFAVGRKARNDIAQGQIILMSDLEFEPTGRIEFDTSGSVDY